MPTIEIVEKLLALLKIKEQYKNLDITIHELVTILALEYLKKRFPILSWNCNPRAGKGIDIVGCTDEVNVICEVTAHDPIDSNSRGARFGAQQRNRILGMIEELKDNKAQKKFLFVINERAKDAILTQIKTPQEIEVVNIFSVINKF